jgi:hypothetical protein
MKQLAFVAALAALTAVASAQTLPDPDQNPVEAHTDMPVRGYVEHECAFVLVVHDVIAPSTKNPGLFTYSRSYSVRAEEPGSYLPPRQFKEYASKRAALEAWVDYELPRPTCD